MKTKTKKKISRAVVTVILAVLVIINIFPVLWMISSSIKSSGELFSDQIYLIPKALTWDHYKTVFSEYKIGNWFINSTMTTLGISFLQILVSLLAAFALSYYKTRWNSLFFYFIFITMVVPFQVTMIPNYILISKMKLLNTWTGVILPNVANATIFFFLYQHVKEIPKAYYEVSKIEGGNALCAFKNVALGLCKGAIAAITILSVIDAWNIYFWPLLVLNKPETRTLTIGLKQFLDFESGNRWGPFMATATLATLPIIIVYLFMQRNIIDAFVSSGIKG